jgi:4-amino-4-deoxy-L-arabinose transferase-like glycosyltransferase
MERAERGWRLFFVLGVLVGLIVVLTIWSRQSLVDGRSDPYAFAATAKSLLNGEGFAQWGMFLRRRAPLYPLTIAGLYRVFGEHAIVVQLTQCLFFGGIVALAYDLGRRLFGQRTARIAALLCLFHPALLRYVPDFHLETMFTFLWTLTIWQSVRLVEKPSWGRGAVFGILLGLTSLTKAVLLMYPAVFAAIWLLQLWRRSAALERKQAVGRAFGALTVAALAMVLTIAPWTYRNYRVSGHFVPITTGASDAFLRGFVFSRFEFVTLQKPPYTDAENEVNTYFRGLCEAAGTVCERDDYETDQILNKEAKRRLFAEPGAVARKFVVGLFAFWYEMTSLRTSLAAGALALIAWIFALIGLRQAWRDDRPVWLLLAPILYLNVLLAALLALGRYSVPVLPCLLVVSGFGIDTLLGPRRVPLLGAASPMKREPVPEHSAL